MDVRRDMLVTVWRIPVEIGGVVGEGALLVILESMKMAVPVAASCAGTVTHVAVVEGSPSTTAIS